MPSTPEKVPVIDTESSIDDQHVLARMGYKEEFKRDFSRFELAGLSFSIVGVVPGIAAVLFYSIPYGGPVGMIWGWFTCSVFLIMVALAIAELGSAAPTAGGVYYWTFHFSSHRCRNLVSWLVGYINTVAYTAGVASIDWACTGQIMAAANIGSGGQFVATNAQTFGLFCCLLVLHAILASSATKVIAKMQWIYVSLNIALFLAVVIVLPITTPERFVNKTSYAFGHFQNVSGWPSGYAFIYSFLAPAWTVGGFDTSVHVSEEAKNAPRAVPFAILCSTIIGVVIGWVVNIVLARYMGDDLASIISNPIGQPMATIFDNSVGSKGNLVIWVFMIITLFICGLDLLICASRQIFAFSRDHGLPFSSFLYTMNPRTQTPIYAVCFCAFLAALLGLLSFAGPLAISAVFTMSVVCQYLSLVTPVIARFVGKSKFNHGPFSLGIMGGPVAFFASAYLLFMTIIFLFPSLPDPTSQNMNYTVVVLAGVIFLSLGYYLFPKYGGRYWFTGPVHTVKVADSSDSNVDLKPHDS